MSDNGDMKTASPFSLRLTFEERARLEEERGDQPLGAFIRERLFEGKQAKRRRGKRPVKDHRQLAKLAAMLGQSRIASNLNQLAKAANSGSLPVSKETEDALQSACTEVRRMRFILMRGLGLYPNELDAP
ncbi:plasmid mobilization relaxosome protein MobC [Citromicrobium sp. WPS32]|uniref:plasmid mobilization relaxosome protein MobC n=1 Tax=Citromicrobium sp. WPS32 TaxID=1634517 RepID=UPI0006C91DEA|nr:plasmid mobilization relaxosome protein MobC [Citromicrobium sp. WPS32]KPM12302.1 hypothetical protein WG75_14675 [Citromicrobium sp. WPS32]